MDPLSIIAGVLTLLKICTATAVAVKDFHDGAVLAGAKVKSLLGEVESFTNVLRSR